MSSVRINQIQGYVPAYDLVRGLASLAVFFAHLKPVIFALNGLPQNQYEQFSVFEVFAILGVEFFFALSGLLLGPILYKQFRKENVGQNIKIFLMRRWVRTLPTYYFGLALFFIVFAMRGMPIPGYWPSYLIFMQNPFELHTLFYPVSWSLSIEELFYVVFPALCILIWMVFKNIEKAFIGSAIIIIVFSFAMRCVHLQDFEYWHQEVQRGFLFRLDSIAIGVLAGIYINRIGKMLFALSLGFILLVAAYIFLFLGHTDYSFEKAVMVQIILTFLPLACAVFIKYLALHSNIQKNSFITFFADISYPLYIFHLVWLHIFFAEGSSASVHLLMFYIVFTIGFSYAFYKIIETPILKRRPSYKD